MSVLEYRSPKLPTPIQLPQPPVISRNWFGWAIYLSTSWTWCIGMFLPVLLVRDFGVWGWVMFAIPNVIGAGALGWVYRSAQSSEDTVAAHLLAMDLFSVVTVAFQIFFALWVFDLLTVSPGDFALATMAIALFGVAYVLVRAPSLAPWIAIGVFAVCVVCAFQAWGSGELVNAKSIWHVAARRPIPGSAADLLALSASTCFGFILCPHLDFTLQRARQTLSNGHAKLAFGIGFGVVFFATITFSLLYSFAFVVLMFASGTLSAAFQNAMSIYFVVQLAFTIGVHWQRALEPDSQGHSGKLFHLMLASIALGFAAHFATRYVHAWELTPFELVYRLFLGFYGLIFPAYVWLCMIPGRGRVAPSRRQLIVLTVVVLLAAPMFWMGFIEKQMVWLLPGVGLVLLARLFIRKRDYAPAAAL